MQALHVDAEVAAPVAEQPVKRSRKRNLELIEFLFAVIMLLLQFSGACIQPQPGDTQLYGNKTYYIVLALVALVNFIFKATLMVLKIENGYRGILWMIAESLAVIATLISFAGNVVDCVFKYLEKLHKFNYPVAALAAQGAVTLAVYFTPTIPPDDAPVRAILRHAQNGDVEIRGRYVGGVLVFDHP